MIPVPFFFPPARFRHFFPVPAYAYDQKQGAAADPLPAGILSFLPPFFDSSSVFPEVYVDCHSRVVIQRICGTPNSCKVFPFSTFSVNFGQGSGEIVSCEVVDYTDPPVQLPSASLVLYLCMRSSWPLGSWTPDWEQPERRDGGSQEPPPSPRCAFSVTLDKTERGGEDVRVCTALPLLPWPSRQRFQACSPKRVLLQIVKGTQER